MKFKLFPKFEETIKSWPIYYKNGLMKTQEKKLLIAALNKYGSVLMIDKTSKEVYKATNTFQPEEFFDFVYLSEYLGIEDFERTKINWDRLFERLSGHKFITELWIRGEAILKLAERKSSLYVIMVDDVRFIDIIEKIVVGRIVKNSIDDLVGQEQAPIHPPYFEN